jgi:hypothetical protein
VRSDYICGVLIIGRDTHVSVPSVESSGTKRHVTADQKALGGFGVRAWRELAIAHLSRI